MFSFLPITYQLKVVYQPSQGEIYADWLEETNQELYDTIKAYDWTARMYPKATRIENVRWP